MSEDKPFVFPAELRIGEVEGVVEALRAWLDGRRDGTVDATGVASVDAAGLQLFVALDRLASERGVALRYRGWSEALLEGAATLGIALPAAQEAAA